MTKKTFDKHLGVKLLKSRSRKGYCEIKLDLKSHHLNHGGIAHGGVLATLCDIVLAGAVATVMKKDQWCVTAQLNINFVYPAFPNEPLIGFGKVVKIGNTLAFVEGGIKAKRKLVAKADGIWVIKNKPSRKIKKAKSLD